ncbi:hypothetical protein CC1G_10420 [Coprinopsis cinerea okayama7|uniref:Uncharacterized protein n=1 Tax=Coprinopsis cinerea (strain Okayama-7 / 130 / ATCC MYA-4618 / FGSC 9003) TaxID=240176 RepID=A8PAR1_COPC7|nr:hypothetical protein CC1G_10420 [Coprinopsis cinerea okayama7\|eukprot:XP_001840036.1 hypothetical protein CC1G_10420 [Coprinopsis cinerea okayama7\
MTGNAHNTPEPVLDKVDSSAPVANEHQGTVGADHVSADKNEVGSQADVSSRASSVNLPRPGHGQRSKSTAGKAPKLSKKRAYIQRSHFPMLENRRRDRQLAARAAGYAAIARSKHRSIVSRLEQLSNTLLVIDNVLNDGDRNDSDKIDHALALIEQEIGGHCLWDSGDSDCVSLGGIHSDSD